MYSIAAYAGMMADRVRMDAYAAALERHVRQDSVVLDIGAGTGIFALLACQFGARRVYAVEPNDAIEVAREAAAANGFAERIEFIQEASTKVTLPERADVIISDLRGVLPLLEKHLPSIVDARTRLLAPGGTLIPRSDTLWAAVVDSPEIYRRNTAPWKEHDYNLDLRPVNRKLVNTWAKARPKPEEILGEPMRWAAVHYAAVESPNLTGEARFTLGRAGTAHGFLVWFDTELAEGISFSNAPQHPEAVYGSAFFPLCEPVRLEIGDTISVVFSANLIGGDYVWRWDTRVYDPSQPRALKASFQQSTFFGEALSVAKLGRKNADYAPELNEDGEVDAFVLTKMSGEVPLGEIARALQQRFPGRFARWDDALTHAGGLAVKYSK